MIAYLESAKKIENDSRKNRGVGLRLQAEKIILKWDVTKFKRFF